MDETKGIIPVEGNGGQEVATLETFKTGVDDLLAKREYFMQQVLPKLKVDQDYFVIKGKKSLAKGGAEKLATIYRLTATFAKDSDTLEMLGSKNGLLAYVCNLTHTDVLVGQGRGADTVARNQDDPNKAIKMAQKRTFIDAVIRTTGLSDIFTQDLEDMRTNGTEKPAQVKTYNLEAASDKQVVFMKKLLKEKFNCKDWSEGEIVIKEGLGFTDFSLPKMDKKQASEIIDKLTKYEEKTPARMKMEEGMKKVQDEKVNIVDVVNGIEITEDEIPD